MATIKYYLREGLVPPGEATAPNQARYTHDHVHRLRLVRVLREVGGLGIEAIREVVTAIDDPARSLHEKLGVAHRAISPASAEDGGRPELTEIDGLLAELGWQVSPGSPDRAELADALASLRVLGRDVDAAVFLPYARAVEPLAAREIGLVSDASPDAAVESAVVGTVVYGAALAALRRLAQEHHSARRHGGSGP